MQDRNKNVRVLYKKQGKVPQIKFIADMFEVKKMIVQGDLELVKYESNIIVCNNRKKNKNKLPNIVLDFKHISGDFFLIGYDEKIKDFRSLNIEEAMFYADSLQRKSFNYEEYKKWLDKSKTEDINSFKDYQESKKKYNEKTNKEVAIKDLISQESYSEKLLKMILNIQAVILKHIKNINGE